MRTVFYALAAALILLPAAMPARAQDGGAVQAPVIGAPPPTVSELSAQYDERCMQTVYPEVTPKTREEFCACTSAHLHQAMTPEEQAKLATGKGAPIDSKKLAVEVLAPCLAPPLQETTYNSCLGRTNFAHFFRSNNAYEAMCQCVSAGMGSFMAQYGQDLMAALIAQTPAVAGDPLGQITETNDYRSELAKWRNKCLNAYAGK